MVLLDRGAPLALERIEDDLLAAREQLLLVGALADQRIDAQ